MSNSSNSSQINLPLLHFSSSDLNDNYNLNQYSSIQNQSQMISQDDTLNYNYFIENMMRAQELILEKRRRNAIASAQFRIRKREREKLMIEKCKNYEIKIKKLQSIIINIKKQLDEFIKSEERISIQNIIVKLKKQLDEFNINEPKDKRTTIQFILN